MKNNIFWVTLFIINFLILFAESGVLKEIFSNKKPGKGRK